MGNLLTSPRDGPDYLAVEGDIMLDMDIFGAVLVERVLVDGDGFHGTSYLFFNSVTPSIPLMKPF